MTYYINVQKDAVYVTTVENGEEFLFTEASFFYENGDEFMKRFKYTLGYFNSKDKIVFIKLHN